MHPLLRRFGFDDVGVDSGWLDVYRHRVHAEAREQPLVVLDVRIARRQQFLAVENRVRAREETERLQLVEEIWASLAQSPEEVPVPEWHRDLLDERLADPAEQPTRTWEQVQENARRRKR